MQDSLLTEDRGIFRRILPACILTYPIGPSLLIFQLCDDVQVTACGSKVFQSTTESVLYGQFRAQIHEYSKRIELAEKTPQPRSLVAHTARLLAISN